MKKLTNKAFALAKLKFLLILLLAPITLLSQMYIVNEDFSVSSGTTPPISWNNINISGDPALDLWHFDNPGAQTLHFPMTAPFAIFDAGTYSNNGQPEVVALETRSFDASVSNSLLLFFDHAFAPANGAIVRTLNPQLCGDYTIGGSNPDFATFGDAVAALNSNGVSCPVTFWVRNGFYQETLILSNINGVSEVNAVTFRSESGDSTQVIITSPGSGDFAIGIKNTSNIRFYQLGFQAGSKVSTFCIFDDAEDIQITNNRFYTGAGSNQFDILTHDASNIFISSNSFSNARSYGISSGHSKLTISNNVFKENRGMLSSDYDTLYVYNNLVESANMDGCISMGNGGYAEIYNNKVLMSSGLRGFRFSSTNNILVYNNFIYLNGSEQASGLGLYDCPNARVFYNSINIHNNDVLQSSRGISIEGSNHNLQLKNNIFSLKFPGYPIYIMNNIPTNFQADYNNYYAPNQVIGFANETVFNDLQAWGATINGDANSKNIDPFFAANDNPLPYQREMNGAGIPVPEILLDMNGLIRNDTAPDIGCIEFLVDFGVTDLLSPTLDCFQTSMENVTVLLRQFEDVPFKDLQLAYQVNEGTIHYDMIPGTIFNDLEFTFDAKVDISADGEYLFKVWLIDAHDDNMNNDTLKAWRYSKPPPIVSFTYGFVCTGLQFNGVASVAAPYQIVSYGWDFGDGNSSDEQNPIHAYAQVGDYVVKFKAFSDAGCYSGIQQTVNVQYVFSPLSLSLNVQNQICFNDNSSSINVNINGGVAPIRIFLNDTLQTSSTLTNLKPGNYQVRVVDGLNCEVSEDVSILPPIAMLPVIFASADTVMVPFNVSFSFVAEGVESWKWYFGDLTDTSSNPTFTINDFGKIDILLEVYSGEPHNCIETASYTIFAEIQIAISANDIITPNGDDIDDYFEVFTTGITKLSVDIFDGHGRKAYDFNTLDGKWDGRYKNGNEAPDGIYYYVIEAVAYNGEVYARNGIVKLIREMISLSPNPASVSLKIDTKNRIQGSFDCRIYNYQGAVVLGFENIMNEKIFEMDVSMLKDGIYLIVFSDRYNSFSNKLIINHK